ncbi:MAG: LysR family transcriptional regulator [Myxococcota bacterium]
MKRVQRLTTLWNWLPAFRAVAETEHLPSASEALNVSASALSRSIRLLEEDVGQPLFDRVGRNIHLNAAGKKLLMSVRSAMRLVDEGLQAVGEGQLVGAVNISVPGPMASMFVLPAVNGLAADHPELVPVICSYPADQVAALLLRGKIDIGLADEPIADEGLSTEALTTIRHGLYGGPDHPLTQVKRVTVEELGSHPFVAPLPDAQGVTPDQWPPHLPRKIGVRAVQMQVGIDAIARGGMIGVMPDFVARHHRLSPIPFEHEFEETTLYLIRRPALGVESRTEVVVRALRAAIAES